MCVLPIEWLSIFFFSRSSDLRCIPTPHMYLKMSRTPFHCEGKCVAVLVFCSHCLAFVFMVFCNFWLFLLLDLHSFVGRNRLSSVSIVFTYGDPH